MTNTLPGATLSDAKGERRIRKLEDTRLNIWLSIIAAMDKVGCIEHEIAVLQEQREADRIRALVDKPALGKLKREGWM